MCVCFLCVCFVSEIASARQKQKDPKDQSCVKKGLQVMWWTTAHCSFPGSSVMTGFSDSDDAY